MESHFWTLPRLHQRSFFHLLTNQPRTTQTLTRIRLNNREIFSSPLSSFSFGSNSPRETAMSPSLSWAIRVSPVLRKGHLSLLHHKQPRCALTLTSFNFKETNDGSRPLYEPLEEVERLENYRPGGYHPIQIGDHFHGRYRVVHKLGHGSYSTAWLARDEQSNKYVALKIGTADANPKEVDIISPLTRLRCLPVNHPGKKNVSFDSR